jgi:hypothetical protein
MVSTALKLQRPITAHCASQTLDNTMKEIALSSADWAQLRQLEELFLIFVRPSQKLQGSEYPTLNYAIPQYLRMINKLTDMRNRFGLNSMIGQACNMAILKLDDYYTSATSRAIPHSIIATICDPRLNINVFDILWDSSSSELKKRRVRK